jgi:hypothetical protein
VEIEKLSQNFEKNVTTGNKTGKIENVPSVVKLFPLTDHLSVEMESLMREKPVKPVLKTSDAVSQNVEMESLN